MISFKSSTIRRVETEELNEEIRESLSDVLTSQQQCIRTIGQGVF